MTNFYKKILNFIKYHNSVPIIFTIIFVGFSISFAASPQVREGIFTKKEMEVGIDNTLLLTTNIDNWDFQPKILSIEEDDENYYVTYQFRTLGVKDNVWQEIPKENLLKFPKIVLGNRDLADYVTEEISEVILHEYQLLKDSQKIAQRQGLTKKQKVIAYKGLIGKILNLKPKIIIEEQNNLVAQIGGGKNNQISMADNQNQNQNNPPTEQQPSQPQNPSLEDFVDKELIRQIVEEILAEKQQKNQEQIAMNSEVYDNNNGNTDQSLVGENNSNNQQENQQEEQQQNQQTDQQTQDQNLENTSQQQDQQNNSQQADQQQDQDQQDQQDQQENSQQENQEQQETQNQNQDQNQDQSQQEQQNQQTDQDSQSQDQDQDQNQTQQQDQEQQNQDQDQDQDQTQQQDQQQDQDQQETQTQDQNQDQQDQQTQGQDQNQEQTQNQDQQNNNTDNTNNNAENTE